MNKIEEIKEYISLLENSSLSVLEIEKEDGTKICLLYTSRIIHFAEYPSYTD